MARTSRWVMMFTSFVADLVCQVDVAAADFVRCRAPATFWPSVDGAVGQKPRRHAPGSGGVRASAIVLACSRLTKLGHEPQTACRPLSAAARQPRFRAGTAS